MRNCLPFTRRRMLYIKLRAQHNLDSDMYADCRATTLVFYRWVEQEHNI